MEVLDVPGDGNCLIHSVIKICDLIEFDYTKHPCLLLSDRLKAVQYLRNLAYAHAINTIEDRNIYGDKEGLEDTLRELPQMGQWSNSYYAYGLCIQALGLQDRIGIIDRGRIHIPSPTGVYLACTGGHFLVHLDRKIYKPMSDAYLLKKEKARRIINEPMGRLASYVARLCSPHFCYSPIPKNVYRM
jgi:hypothetical protein